MYRNTIFSRQAVRSAPAPAPTPNDPNKQKLFARRDRLQKDGIQFKNPDAPLDVVLHIDIPSSVMNQSYGKVCRAIGDRINYRLKLSYYRDAGCLPQNDKVRIKLTYELNDLPFHEDEHTARLVHLRILENLRPRLGIKVPYHRYVEDNKVQDLYEALRFGEWSQD